MVRAPGAAEMSRGSWNNFITDVSHQAGGELHRVWRSVSASMHPLRPLSGLLQEGEARAGVCCYVWKGGNVFHKCVFKHSNTPKWPVLTFSYIIHVLVRPFDRSFLSWQPDDWAPGDTPSKWPTFTFSLVLSYLECLQGVLPAAPQCFGSA